MENVCRVIMFVLVNAGSFHRSIHNFLGEDGNHLAPRFK